MGNDQYLDTHQKALSLNLDTSIYGSLVEIGAGQEVAANFFRVGGAAGTIAKTMSAYDMKVSDEIYGKVSRYVSNERVIRMVDREYDLLEERLKDLRGENNRFFSFADTVSARNYQGSNICHGWMGIRFQRTLKSKTSYVVFHINMLDETHLRQQQALGVLGINLIYAAYHYVEDLNTFLDSLLDSLRIESIEIDYIDVGGHGFEAVDHVELNLDLVKRGLCHSVMFTSAMKATAPLELLYKRPVVVERGLFRNDSPMYAKILERSLEYLKEEGTAEREPVSYFEISVNNDENDFNPVDKERISNLVKFGHPVMVSSFSETYLLTGFLSRYTDESVRFVQGIDRLIQGMQERFYQDLDAGILSAMSLLFARDVRLYVFGIEIEELMRLFAEESFDASGWELPTKGEVNLQNIFPQGYTRHLYAYLLETGALVDIPYSSK